MTQVNRDLSWRRSEPPISTNEIPSWDDTELPHLRSLTIPGLCFTRGIAVASLKTLVLSDGPRTGSHDIFLSALERCSRSLESLTLHRWVHPDPVTDALASRITPVVPLPNLRRLEIELQYNDGDMPPPTSLFAGLSLSPSVAIHIDWSCNPENTRELLRNHLSELHFDSVSLHLSGPPKTVSVHCFIGDTELLSVRAHPTLRDPLGHKAQSLVTKFLEDHRYATATQLAVDLDVFSQDGCTSLVQDDALRRFVDAFPNLRRLDLLGKTIGRAKLAMAKAFLDLPHPAAYHPTTQGTGNFKTLGYVFEVSEQQKAQNPIGFVDVLRAQLDALEALLADSAAAGSSRLHRLELCVVYTSLSQPHPPTETYPYVYDVSASTELTAFESPLPVFSAMFPSGFTNLLPLALSFAPFAALWGDAVTVQLDQATVYGTTNGSVTSYLGIPFAEPPVGDLRLRLPKPIESYNGMIDATQVGPRCFQLLPPLRTDMPAELLQDVVAALTALSPVETQPESEDCLNLNVVVPAGTPAGANLPVLAFIFAGGFSWGSNTQFDGEAIVVQKSIDMGQPIIFAAVNYRLHAFGFLGGKEVKDAGVANLGLHDR
ncbi:hypothetical protein GSI_13377 [Ganoderma sinense ZZ0214-1]|uniref:Carboxylesterase type B domain-containing protein n=1 Tax=Ganoderma sinense ZZ0214-1 TaxID=1077348 RepID=A0A2G8RVG0_9APHY|nr:hypothetical protein GSI_13377 [Ganoderma sinense ZZ0214-1]